MKLEDLRRKAKGGIDAPKKRFQWREEIKVEVKIDPRSYLTTENVAKACDILSNAGKLNKEQYERFIHLMLDKSVIKEEGDRKNED